MANEKRLIDANALVERMNKRREDFVSAWRTYGAMPDSAKAAHHENLECALMVSETPTVDAVEVVHGRWLNWKELFPNKFALLSLEKRKGFCSHCGAFKKKDNFCPNCGAKMDGGIDNDI